MTTEQSPATPDAGIRPSRYGLGEHGIRNINIAYWNLGTAQLLEHAVRRREGLFATGGSYVVRTGQFTGRSPRDKFIVRDETTENNVQWGPVNQPMTPAAFDRLYSKMLAYWQGQDLFVQDCFAGADPRYTLPIRVITQFAWHAVFARQLFVRPDPLRTQDHVPEFTIFFAPRLQATPAEDETNSDTCIVVNFTKKVVLICGTSYAGEMKKSVFTILNYLLPERGIMPMHCSCNVGNGGGVAVFFGLSGTGKTTLSADPQRRLIGDDEHGWSDHGVFNFEGGCYAKCIRLSRENEPRDLERNPLRNRARKCSDRRRNPASRFRFRRLHGKYSRRLSVEVHRSRRTAQRGRSSQQHHPAYCRRVRRTAAHRAAHARADHVPFPERIYRQSRRYRTGIRQRSLRPPLARVSARHSCPVRQPNMPPCWATECAGTK